MLISQPNMRKILELHCSVYNEVKGKAPIKTIGPNGM